MKSGEDCNKCIAAHIVHMTIHVIYQQAVFCFQNLVITVFLLEKKLQKDAPFKRASQTTAKSRRTESPAVSRPNAYPGRKTPTRSNFAEHVEILHCYHTPAPQENFHRFPQFMHSQNVVIGSSADLVCAWLYATFRCLQFPHWNSVEIDFSTCATIAWFMFCFSRISSSARRESDFSCSCVMVTNVLGAILPERTSLRRAGLDLFLRFWKRERIFCL
jgi:hypothetical protein